MESFLIELVKYLVDFVVRDPGHAIPILVIIWVVWRGIRSMGEAATRMASLPEAQPPSATEPDPETAETWQSMGQARADYDVPARSAESSPNSVFDSDEPSSVALPPAHTSMGMQQQRAAMDKQETARQSAILLAETKEAERALAQSKMTGWTALDAKMAGLTPNQANVMRAVIFAQALGRPRRSSRRPSLPSTSSDTATNAPPKQQPAS